VKGGRVLALNRGNSSTEEVHVGPKTTNLRTKLGKGEVLPLIHTPTILLIRI
jgi:hypothetical protein